MEWNEVQVTITNGEGEIFAIHQFSNPVETLALQELLLKAQNLETAYDEYPEASSAHELIDDLHTASNNHCRTGLTKRRSKGETPNEPRQYRETSNPSDHRRIKICSLFAATQPRMRTWRYPSLRR